MDIDVITRTCTKCGTTKLLSQFHRQPSGKKGRSSWCAECSTKSVKEAQARRRAEMGEEAWLEHRRQIVGKHRERFGSDKRGSSAAYDRSLAVLRDNHRAEFDAILRRIRYEMGLDI